jgi:hypothetical protein
MLVVCIVIAGLETLPIPLLWDALKRDLRVAEAEKLIGSPLLATSFSLS